MNKQEFLKKYNFDEYQMDTVNDFKLTVMSNLNDLVHFNNVNELAARIYQLKGFISDYFDATTENTKQQIKWKSETKADIGGGFQNGGVWKTDGMSGFRG